MELLLEDGDDGVVDEWRREAGEGRVISPVLP